MKGDGMPADLFASWFVIEKSLANVRSIFTRISLYDLVFVLCAIAFNLSIVGVFIAQKKKRLKLVRAFGIFMLSLSLPLAVVFVQYLLSGRELWIIVYFGFIFLYILVEWLLDFIFKVEFRRKWITHVPYILLEYVALFGFIGISFAIDETWGYLVAISFWMVLGALIYLYRGRQKKESEPMA